MAYLEMESVEKSFAKNRVLTHFNLSIEKGEFTTLVGPSGCGKTTTLRILAGLERPDRGTISLEGVPITDWPPQRRQISMVFQSYALFPNLTVFGNIAFGLWAKRIDRLTVEREVMNLLDIVGLKGLENRFPHELSGGQQQRVALARALAPRPKVLLLDEPLSAVDAVVRLRLREELKRIQRELGITTVMVTHDQEEALSISDRVVVMNGGRIEQVGTPVEIYRHPVNRFVAQFIGFSNALRVERKGDSQEVFFHHYPINLPPLSLNGEKRLTLYVRPETLRLHRPHELRGREYDTNLLPGIIRLRAFYGAITRFEVMVNGEIIWVDVPGHEADSWQEGDEVVVSFSPQEVRIITGGGEQ